MESYPQKRTALFRFSPALRARNTVHHMCVHPHTEQVLLTFVTCNAHGCFLFHSSPACFFLLHLALVAIRYNKLIL